MKRRDFFKIMGVASGAALTACNANNADKKLLPYLVPPEDGIIPGLPRFSRSTCTECPALCGIDVKIRDDKPVKLEGNPDHPINKGALCIRGQASLSKLYNPNRLKTPLLSKSFSGGPGGRLFKKAPLVSWEKASKLIKNALEESRQKGLRNVFLSSRTTGTLSPSIDEFCKEQNIERLKEVEIFHHGAIKQANQKVFGLSSLPHYRIDTSDVLVTLGADILDTFVSPVEWAKQYREAKKKNNIKWYHIEPYLTLTGASADERAVIDPGSELYLVAYLLHNISHRNPLPAAVMAQVPGYSLDKTAEITGLKTETIQAIAKTLEKAAQPLIISGGPAVTKTNGFVTAQYTALLQWALDMPGKTVDFHRSFNDENVGTINDLIAFGEACRDKKIGTVFFSRLNGFAALPAFVDVMKEARFKVALSDMPGPVTAMCDLVLPLSHPLESWGDAQPRKGIKSIIQPALKPLYDTKSEGDALLFLSGKDKTFRDVLAEHWQDMDEKWIEQGFKEETFNAPAQPVGLVKEIKLEKPGLPYQKDCLYIIPSLRTYDGRSSGTALLAEIPDPLSAVSYGKYLALSSAGAGKANLSSGDVVEIETIVGKSKFPVHINPGLPPGIMTVGIDALTGTDMQVDRGTGEFMFLLEKAGIVKTAEKQPLPVLAGAWQTGKRGILPHMEEHDPHHHPYKRYTLFPPHEHKNYRWGMVIDLDACTGCSACAAACYIENNIPLVGREEHLKGREMSWLRIEPYYNNPEQPEFLPMMCQHCDCAPCETVCPVYATYHTPEGLNAQVYNRCVGTRYCANNCPYKARRFNWFKRKDSQPLYRVSNPDLSVRPAGVMEKCTFCIQRIRFAKDRAKDENRLVKDGEIIPACAQTCPTDAIVFGNLMDPKSKVSQLAKSAEAYRVQEQLGTEPAIYYIKRKV